MRLILNGLIRNRSGATSIEYAIIGMTICVVIVAGVTQAGMAVGGIFDQVALGFAN